MVESTAVEALKDLFVLEMDCGIAGALAGMFLCDNGARVMKVEPPQGVQERQHSGHRVWNRRNESWMLDSQQPEHMAQWKQVLGRADVLIHRSLSAEARTLQLSVDELVEVNPRLVVCTISSYSRQGALSVRSDNDTLVDARFGLSHLQRGWFAGASYIVHPLASIGAAMLTVQGVCVALLARTHTRRGQIVEASLLGGLYALTTYCVGEHVKQDCTEGWRAFDPSPFYSMYECADGRWLALGCIYRGFVKKAIEAMGLTRVLGDTHFGDGFDLLAGEGEKEIFAHVACALKTKLLPSGCRF